MTWKTSAFRLFLIPVIIIILFCFACGNLRAMPISGTNLEITAYDSNGSELTLKNGDEILLTKGPWSALMSSSSGSNSMNPFLLIVPDGTDKIRLTFSPLKMVVHPTHSGSIIIDEIQQTIDAAGCQIAGRKYSGNVEEDAIVIELNAIDLDMDKLKVPADTSIFVSRTDISSQPRPAPGIELPPGMELPPVPPIKNTWNTYFTLLHESTPVPYVKNVSEGELARGDTLLLNLEGKTSENQKMALYYQWRDSETYEAVTSLYGEADDLENGTVSIDLSDINFPFEKMFLANLDTESYYTLSFFTEIENIRSPICQVKVIEPNTDSLRSVKIFNDTGTYCSASLWVNIGVNLKKGLAEGSTVEYYLSTDKAGKQRVASVVGRTVPASEMNSINEASDSKNGRQNGLRIENMDAGNYYVIVKLTEPAAEGEEPIVSAEAIPFTVYEDANAYVKAALDRLLHYYFLEQGSFTFNQKNSKDVWEYGGLLAEGNGSTDGRSWETIALTALGTAYPFDDNPEYGLPFQTENAAVKDEPDGMISFAIDGPVLSHQDGRNRRDYFNSLPIYSDETPNAKSLFRIAVSGVAAGCDPREKNLINELIRCGYVDYDIKKGELNYRNDGTLIIPPDGFALSYTLLTLEICHATVEEGFTKEYRNAGARTLLKAIKDFNETPLKPGSGGTSGDTIGMIYLPAPWLAEDELVDAEIRADLKAELAKLNDNVKNNLYRNGGVGWFSADRVAAGEYAQNVNSMGVLFNMMVLNGATAEDIGSWQAEDGTLLTALVGGQDVNKGIFGFNGAVDNWLATYQPLGALVDLYNGRNFYEYAQDTYDETYPQYTKRGDELLKQMRALPETVSSVDTIIAVNAAREAYHDFTSHLPEKADPEKIAAYYLNAADLNALEASAVEFVHYLIDELPADDLQTTADHEAVAYAREAFNTLSKDGQNSLGRENRDKLERAEKNIDKFAAAEAARLILALPDADGVVAADAGDILAARAAYNGLSEQQRKLVDGKTAAKLVSAERALEQLGAAAVKAAVAAIPGMSDLSLDDAAFVEEVRAAYDALSDVQKLAVTNIADLIKAETKLQKLAKTAAADQAAASAVADAIADLGKAENIGAADENEVKAARKAYSKLTDAQKALVANEEDLIAAEKAVDSAKKAAAQTAADEAAADRAEKAIAAIGEVTPGSEKAIANAREIYDALSDEQKSLVENGDVLMAAESEWAELTDEAEQAKTEAEAAAKAMADQKAADQAVSAIEAIGEVTLGSEKAIAKARAAYDGLSDDQKELVENAADLETAEEALAQLKTDTAAANAVRDLIDRLSDGDEITLADAKEAAAARKAFSRLSDAQKALVDNEDVLKAAEEAIGDLKAADAVEKAIDAVGEVTINSEEAIKAARAAYDALTDVQKDRVRNAAALTDAEKRWAELTGQRFVDVTQGMYCFDAVRWAVENGVTLGTDENHFSPDSACTRGQVVTFLWRAAGSPEVIAEHSFVDVAAGSYYEKAVLWAAAEEITEGTSDTTFSPNNPCTRGQVATFLWRAKGQPAAAVNSANPFTDVLPGSYYETAVLWAAANGVTNGIGENRFAPNDPCTRGQVVTFLFRAK